MSDAFALFIRANPVIFAALFGVIPAVVWLWFWLKEDIHPEPTKFIVFTFLAGMLAVFVALPLQHVTEPFFAENSTALFFVWAFIEESLKFGAAWIGGIHSKVSDEPIDPIIYMLIAALGFVAMENTLFLIDPLISGNIADSLITGNLRFIGAALLHIMSSGVVGISVALAFFGSKKHVLIYIGSGLILATTLHALFNLIIMNSLTGNIFSVFGIVWIGLVCLMLVLERIKRIPVERVTE